jgi:hypothetical protein
MGAERPDHTLQATALVNAAYLHLADQSNPRSQNRAHFFAVATRAMRRILVSYARRSHAEFIIEHYWGYTALRSGCVEYRVEHPRWKIWNATDFELNADVVTLYGEQFGETLSQPPRSAFVADGSPITIHRRELLLL